MPSGAGHDAMKLHEIMPQAMLFVRGLNAGISQPAGKLHRRRHATVRRCLLPRTEPAGPRAAMTDMNQDKQATYAALDAWIDQHFDEEVQFLQALVQAGPRTPHGAAIEDGKLYGRAAVSKSDFATFTYAVRALEAVARPSKGAVELHFTYDEEFGGILGPGWLLANNLTQPDLMVAAGFSYEVVTAHNGCLQMEVTVQGKMAHAAVPHTGVDALQAAVVLMNALYAENTKYQQVTSKVPGIKHPYLNIGRIEGGTNTNVVPGKVVLKIDRRMIPEENPAEVEASIRAVIAQAIADFNAKGGYTGEDAVRVDIKRLLLANAMTPLAGNKPLVDAIQAHGEAVFGEKPPAVGTPLYTDVRLYVERGIPGVIYGAGPHRAGIHAKRADERLVLEDLRRAQGHRAHAVRPHGLTI
ncbi:Aminoacylase-1 [Manis javanica]|nr:Aminoacylase-1 [Manis javanica]